MAELTPQERLQPSLLDRLTDDDAHNPQESREKRVLSARALRQAVLRDLRWLLNSGSLEQNLNNTPLAERSVINYCMSPLSGRTASGLDLAELERRIRQVIWDFEPRLLRETVRVTVLPTEEAEETHPNQVFFEIQAELWGQPLPETLYLRTALDLEIDEIRIFEPSSKG